MDEHVLASMAAVEAFDPETGWYGTLRHEECKTREEAAAIKQALYRAAQHLKVSMATEIIKEKDGTFTVEFKAINKAHAQAYIAAKCGGDRSKLAYDPRAPRKAT